jgi:hypothetical protein
MAKVDDASPRVVRASWWGSGLSRGLAKALVGLFALLSFEIALDLFAALSHDHVESIDSPRDSLPNEGQVIASSELADLEDAGTLTVRVDEAEVTLDYALTLDAGSPLVERVLRGSPPVDGAAIVSELTGPIFVDDAHVEFAAPEVEYESGEQTAQLTSTAYVEREDALRVVIDIVTGFNFEERSQLTVELTAQDLRIETEVGPLPQRQDGSFASWTLMRGDILTIRAEPFVGNARRSLRRTLAGAIDNVQDYAGVFVMGVLGALPFLFLMVVLRRRRARSELSAGVQDVTDAMSATLLFVGAYAAVYVFILVSDLVYLLGWRLNRAFTLGGADYDLVVGRALTPVLVALAVVAWPAWVRAHARSDSEEPSAPRWAWVVPVCLLAAPFVVVVIASRHTTRFLPDTRTTVAALAVTIVLCLLLSWFLARVFLRGEKLLAASLAGAAINLVMFQRYAYGDDLWQRALAVGGVGLAGFALACWLGRASVVAILGREGLTPRRGRLIVIAGIVVAFPFQALADDFGGWVGAYSATYSMIGLIRIALVLVLVTLVWRQPSLGIEAEPEAAETDQRVGIVLVAAALLSPTSTVLLIPLKLLVGIPMFLWLFRVESAHLYRRITRAATNKRTVAEELVALVRRERRLDSLEAETLEKLGSAEHASVARAGERLRDEIAARRGALGLTASENARVLWVVGPDVSRNERARRTAVLSLLVSIPSIFLFIGGYLKDEIPEYELVFLTSLESIGTAVLTWTMYGFVFGYYYEFIRGHSGLTKAFNFSLALIVSSLALTAGNVLFHGSSWSGGIMFALQIFILAMILGLVMDLRMLQRAGMGWRHMVEIHRLGGIVAWGTSVVVAVGAVVATALSAGIVDVLADALAQLDPSGPPAAPAPSTSP